MNARKTRALAALILMMWVMLAPSAAPADEVFVEPTLPPTADAYDSAHPELLAADQLVASSAILIEANSGSVIYEKNADAIMYPASTTKILTTYLGIVSGDLDRKVTADEETTQFDSETESVIPLRTGEEITMRDLLYATMIKSGNDGAVLIAKSVAGSTEAFAALMNDSAAKLGCTSSHFVNPHGLHNDAHYTTARDMAIIARAAMSDVTFQSIARSVTYTLPASNTTRSRTLTTSSDILNAAETSYYYPYATGIKTGFTSKAGYCFVGAATKDNTTLISVVFYTSRRGRWSDTKKLMEYGFSQYVSTSIAELYALNQKVVDVSGFALNDAQLGRLALDIRQNEASAADSITVTKERQAYLALHFNSLVSVEYTRDITAPIMSGETVGTMTYYNEAGDAVMYDLIASRTVLRREAVAPTLTEIKESVAADPNPFPEFSFEVGLLLAGLLLVLGVAIWLLRAAIRSLLGLKESARAKRIKPKTRYYR